MSVIPAIRSSSTYVGADSLVSQQPTSPKRQKSEETFAPSFDVEGLSAEIFSQLLELDDENKEQMVANQISASNVELMLQFSVYRPSEILKFFRESLNTLEYETDDRESICLTIHQLCIISLLNSKYQETMASLEGNIDDYLEASQQERFHQTIGLAQTLLAVPVPKLLQKLQEHSGALRQMEADISKVLGLFYYVSDDSRECIEILARETKSLNEVLRYPLCEEQFAQLCQNLNLLSNEKSELMRLLTAIRAKQSHVGEAIKLVLKTQESKEASLPSKEMIPARNRFYNENVDLLWTVGGELLKKVFTDTLARKKAHKDWSLPRGLVFAINMSAAKSAGWKKFHYDALFPIKGSIPTFPELEVSFVWDVWENYAKGIDHLTDLGCFMRQFLNELPEPSFQKLAGVSKENRGKALERAFFQKFKKGEVLVALKNWAHTLKPLRE